MVDVKKNTKEDIRFSIAVVGDGRVKVGPGVLFK